MPTPPPSQPPPPPPPQQHHHLNLPRKPDFIFTALSIFIAVSNLQRLSFSITPPRFLRIHTMSPNRRRNPNPNPNLPFPTPQSLSDWLKPRLPSDSFSSWGIKPGTKNVNNLWLEISEGETSLADSTPPVRSVEVVVVRVVGKDGNLLLESHQELSNGDVRSRGRPLSEKMKPGETVEGAVYRAIKEELGSVLGENEIDNVVRIVPDSYVKKVEERASGSYPGLPACYVLHTVDAVVEGLPEGEFCTEEVEEYKEVAECAVSCKKHYWKWVDSGSV